jgi:hypothetical protein
MKASKPTQEMFCNRDRGRRMWRASVTCVFAILVIAASTESSAQYVPATITLFSDPSGDSCTLIDDKEGLLNVYVVNKIAPGLGLVGSRFRVASSEGFNAEYASELIHLPAHMGDLRAGVDIAYNYCYSGSLLLATITYMGHGTSSPCGYLEVLPHPVSYFGTIEVMVCNFDTYPGATLGPLLVNPSSGQCAPWCGPVSTQSTTWGAVKALYR